METYHGYNYTLGKFDRDKALQFILNHFVFIDAAQKPIELQHEFIDKAKDVVDNMEKSHNLRASYYHHVQSFEPVKKNVLLSTLIGVGSAFFTAIAIARDALAMPNLSNVAIMSGAMSLMCLTLPTAILIKEVNRRQILSQELLTSIHDLEMNITSILSLAGIKNTITMTRQSYDNTLVVTAPRTLN